jgi:hypothetical protein
MQAERVAAAAALDDGKCAALSHLAKALRHFAGLAVVIDAVGQPNDARGLRVRFAQRLLSIAPTAASRSGAKGCGVMAAAVERAAPGASMATVSVLVGLAVGMIATARRCDSASAMTRSIMRARSVHCEAPAQPLSTTMAMGPLPASAASREGLRTGSAKARMISAAASRRMSVSHHGDLAGVFSRFSKSMRIRVGGNVTCRGRGGTVRKSQ